MSIYDKGLAALIPRNEPRSVDQRSEERLEGLVDCAVLVFRDRQYQVPVVNISSRGTMVESGIIPRIGETVSVEFAHCARIRGFVRWIRDGRIGINFGHELVVG